METHITVRLTAEEVNEIISALYWEEESSVLMNLRETLMSVMP